MASSHSNSHSEPAKIEQIITEFFSKSLHIILESRSPCASSRNFSGEQTFSSPSSTSSSSSSIRPRDKWFNLALRDCSAALENIDLWRQSNLEPMVVDVILIQRPLDCDPLRCSPRSGLVKNLSVKELSSNFWNSGQEEYLSEEKSEKIIERWVIQYESQKSRDFGSVGKRSGGISSNSLYKKSIILLRSLYLTVRLLPAYKLFKDLNSSGQIHTFTLAHKVSSFVEPFTRREEAEMQQYGFTPVDASCGRLCLSVLYRPTLSGMSLEPSTPMSPQFISDYVGSPMTDPLKRFPSLPQAGFVSHDSPSSTPFARRHSWGNDLYRGSLPSLSPSPSPTYSDYRFSNPSSRGLPPMSLPRHPPETPSASNVSLTHKTNTSFDGYLPSPTFCPSPSPSPPTNIPGSHLSKTLFRTESAPVSIPAARLVSSPGLSFNHILPPSPFSKGTRPSCSPQEDNSRALMRLGDVQTGGTPQKFSLGKDEVGNFSAAKLSSNSSLQISYSRSSSRLSLREELDDEIDCPFAMDDDDIRDTHTRPESFDGRGIWDPLEPGGLLPVRKSQDAAVGSLVRMLRTAPPLRQDFSNSMKMSQASKPETWSNSIQEPEENAVFSSIESSEFLTSKTTADALEELRSYKQMKDLLLRQGSGSQTLANVAPAAESE